MEFLKTIAGKVISGVVALAVIGGGIAWWNTAPQTKSMILGGIGHIVAWFGIVLLVPWATFFLIGWVAKFESNAIAGALVFVYTALEVMLLCWLVFGWQVHGAAPWTFVALGALVAGVYNLFTCDWLAERVGGT
jgi:hypothetical protein